DMDRERITRRQGRQSDPEGRCTVQPSRLRSMAHSSRNIRFLPLSQERVAIELVPSQVHAGNLTCVANVVERISIEHQEVGVPAFGDHANIGETKRFCRPRCCGDDRLSRRQSHLYPVRDFMVHAGTESVSWTNTGISAEY